MILHMTRDPVDTAVPSGIRLRAMQESDLHGVHALEVTSQPPRPGTTHYASASEYRTTTALPSCLAGGPPHQPGCGVALPQAGFSPATGHQGLLPLPERQTQRALHDTCPASTPAATGDGLQCLRQRPVPFHRESCCDGTSRLRCRRPAAGRQKCCSASTRSHRG